MSKRLLTAALIVAGALLVPESIHAHGGQYRGPGDTVPPGGGGGTGGSPGPAGPAGPTSPTPGTPFTPGPMGPGGGGTVAPSSGPRTGDTGPDLTAWTFWWEFNKEPFLNLKSHVHDLGTTTGTDGFYLGRGERQKGKDSLRPSEVQIRQRVVPALQRALEKESNNDILTGCLIALAKIGDTKSEEGDSEFEPLIARFLTHNVQEVRETAAVALGILANDRSVPTLAHLVFDSPEGRKLVDAREVDNRTRAFAAYGLGLIGARTTKETVRLDVVDRLERAIRDDSTRMRDLKVACLVSMGLVPLSTITPLANVEKSTDDESPRITCRTEQIDYLLEYLADENQRHLVRAHAPTAVGRLLDGLPPKELETYKPRITKALLERLGRRANDKLEVVQSSILALGMVGDADNDQEDRDIREALAAVPKDVKDVLARRFALIAMAKVAGNPGGGEKTDEGISEASKFLLTRLGKGSDVAWAGLGIGVLGRLLNENDNPGSAVGDLTAALRDALREEKSGDKLGALALGAGILRDQESTTILLEKLSKTRDPEARGYIALGLGLMDARPAVEPIQRIVEDSRYRPELLQQAAIALGLLGDKDLVVNLLSMLREAKSLGTQAAIASALGFIGDKRSIDPLVAMLENDDISDRARGFAAVALGIVADKEILPWNSKIAVDLNYTASTQTLNDTSGTGILNIL